MPASAPKIATRFNGVRIELDMDNLSALWRPQAEGQGAQFYPAMAKQARKWIIDSAHQAQHHLRNHHGAIGDKVSLAFHAGQAVGYDPDIITPATLAIHNLDTKPWVSAAAADDLHLVPHRSYLGAIKGDLGEMPDATWIRILLEQAEGNTYRLLTLAPSSGAGLQEGVQPLQPTGMYSRIMLEAMLNEHDNIKLRFNGKKQGLPLLERPASLVLPRYHHPAPLQKALGIAHTKG